MCFFFNDTATTEIYTLSLHDALPILAGPGHRSGPGVLARDEPDGPVRAREPRADPQARRAQHRRARDRGRRESPQLRVEGADRKSTRLNSSHANISYAVFCLKKKRDR